MTTQNEQRANLDEKYVQLVLKLMGPEDAKLVSKDGLAYWTFMVGAASVLQMLSDGVPFLDLVKETDDYRETLEKRSREKQENDLDRSN